MKQEIKVVECNTVKQAESEYFKLRQEGCWQMVKVLEVAWSWRKFRYVARFSMKRVEKAYHMDDHLKNIIKISQIGAVLITQYRELKKVSRQSHPGL